jgi:hypothetical protein
MTSDDCTLMADRYALSTACTHTQAAERRTHTRLPIHEWLEHRRERWHVCYGGVAWAYLDGVGDAAIGHVTHTGTLVALQHSTRPQ